MIGRALSFFIDLFRFHKLKLLTLFGVALIFFVWMFPTRDLSDLAQSKINQATGLNVQFDDMGLSLIPSPGIALDNPSVELSGLPAIGANSLEANVSLMSALTAKIAAHLSLYGIFAGDVAINYAQGSTSDAGVRTDLVDTSISKVDIAALSKYLKDAGLIPVSAKGKINLSSALKVDPSFKQQPSGTAKLDINGFDLPDQTIEVVTMTDRGPAPIPFEVPGLQLSSLKADVRMNDGQVQITDMKFASPKGELVGKANGTLSLRMVPNGIGGVQALFEGYDLEVDVTANKQFMNTSAIGSYLKTLISGVVKEEKTDTTRYKFRARPGFPIPQITRVE